MTASSAISDPPAALRAAAPMPAHARWVPLGGGRSNQIWRVEAEGAAPIVAKLYRAAQGNALFPNDPGAEALALRALSGSGLAPELLGETAVDGGSALFYGYCAGRAGDCGASATARLLQKLHDAPAPKGLRLLPGGSSAIRASAEVFLHDLPDDTADNLAALRPGSDVPDAPDRAFLHGDPVPANIVRMAKTGCLIDWQCPALGDPCEDIAVYLSPAMQSLYGGAPMAEPDIDAFLHAYDRPAITARYRQLAPHFHWRMAIYCRWKAARGDRDYLDAAAMELAALATASGLAARE